MTLGQLLAWMVWVAALLARRRQRLLTFGLTAALGLRFISQLVATRGSWLQRYAAIAFSPAGSLLLWAILTCLVTALVGRWPAARSAQPAAGSHRSGRAILILIALLLVAEQLSRPPSDLNELASHVSIIMVIHTLAILGSYACQSVLLAHGISAIANDEHQHRDQTVPRLVAWATGLQLLGTVSGSIWAAKAWGTPWSWDPIECLSLAALIWLTTLHGHGSRLHAEWYRLGVAITALYTIMGTVLVRSGLLARASRHGYLSGAALPLATTILATMAILVWMMVSRVRSDALPIETQTAFIWGWGHWLAGFTMALVPALESAIVPLLYTAWAVGCAWMLVRSGLTLQGKLRVQKKP